MLEPLLELMLNLVTYTSFGREESVACTHICEGCAEVGLVKVKRFQTSSHLSFVVLGSGVLKQELVAVTWLGLPVSSARSGLAHVVPQDLVERGVRHFLYGFRREVREVVRGENMPMSSNELGDKFLHILLEVVVGEEGNLERQVVLGHCGIAKCKNSSKASFGFGPPGLFHVVCQTVEEGDRLVVVLTTAELPGSVIFLLGVAGDGVQELPELCLLG